MYKKISEQFFYIIILRKYGL